MNHICIMIRAYSRALIPMTLTNIEDLLCTKPVSIAYYSTEVEVTFDLKHCHSKAIGLLRNVSLNQVGLPAFELVSYIASVFHLRKDPPLGAAIRECLDLQR